MVASVEGWLWLYSSFIQRNAKRPVNKIISFDWTDWEGLAFPCPSSVPARCCDSSRCFCATLWDGCRRSDLQQNTKHGREKQRLYWTKFVFLRLKCGRNSFESSWVHKRRTREHIIWRKQMNHLYRFSYNFSASKYALWSQTVVVRTWKNVRLLRKIGDAGFIFRYHCRPVYQRRS